MFSWGSPEAGDWSAGVGRAWSFCCQMPMAEKDRWRWGEVEGTKGLSQPVSPPAEVTQAEQRYPGDTGALLWHEGKERKQASSREGQGQDGFYR